MSVQLYHFEKETHIFPEIVAVLYALAQSQVIFSLLIPTRPFPHLYFYILLLLCCLGSTSFPLVDSIGF